MAAPPTVGPFELEFFVQVGSVHSKMSAQNIRAFFDQASGDEALQKQIAEIRQLPPPQAAEALARLSETSPTPFTAEELSDAELEGVAGGGIRWSRADDLPPK